MTAALAAARTIRDRAGGDGHAVAITLGEAGMVLVDPDGRAFTGSSSARGRYPVGSGDALLAGLLAALADGEPWVAAAAAGLERVPPTPRSRAPGVSIPLAPASSRRWRTWLSSLGEGRRGETSRRRDRLDLAFAADGHRDSTTAERLGCNSATSASLITRCEQRNSRLSYPPSPPFKEFEPPSEPGVVCVRVE